MAAPPDRAAGVTTLGLTHLQFEALPTAARDSANINGFALVAMLGLLGLRIFEACAADITDLGEEHGHRVLRVVGRGTKVVLVPLPPAVARATDRAVDGRDTGPILRNRRGRRMTGTPPPDDWATSLGTPVSGCLGCTHTCCGTPSSPPVSTPVSTCATCRSPPGTLTRAPPCGMTAPARASTGTPNYILAAYMARQPDWSADERELRWGGRG